MGDSNGDNQNSRNYDGSRDNRGSFKGGRGRESGGGFRIRLSDNEMRAVQSIQEAFHLRSTVAVLGFAIRTLAQMLEEGKLDNLVKEYRSQSSQKALNKDQMGKGGRRNQSNGNNQKPNPFARPSKPDSTATQSIQNDSEESQNLGNQPESNESNDSETDEQDTKSN